MKIVAAVSIAFVMLIGVTGCGSDDDVQVESRVKNAVQGLDVSDARSVFVPSEGNCRVLGYSQMSKESFLSILDELIFLADRKSYSDREMRDRFQIDDLSLLQLEIDLADSVDRALLDRLRDDVTMIRNPLDLADGSYISEYLKGMDAYLDGLSVDVKELRDLNDLDAPLDDLLHRMDRSRFLLSVFTERFDDLDDRLQLRYVLDQCAIEAKNREILSRRHHPYVYCDEGVKRPFEVAVEQFRVDLSLFRAAQNGKNDQSLTEEQRQGHRENYSSAYHVKSKSAAAAIKVVNERGFNLDSTNNPDNLDESFLTDWDSAICGDAASDSGTDAPEGDDVDGG